MTNLETSAEALLEEAEAKRQWKLTYMEGMRAEYEAKRDWYQALLNAADNVIHDLQKEAQKIN